MWPQIKDRLAKQPERLSIVRKMVELGIRVSEDARFYLGDVEISDTAIARAVNVDRRVVRSSAEQILQDAQLKTILSKLKPSGASLVDVAQELGYQVIVITADPHKPGVISVVTSILAEYGVVVRQALADDPDLTPEPKLTLVLQGTVPPEALVRARSVASVSSVTLR
ncbi:MAG: amino acid-binding protein [Thaumarchaeota archaeon]|nr:amino acid-binding protein [Nitrososphaerota archaeon]